MNNPNDNPNTTIAAPSPIVLDLAAKFASGEPLLYAQIGALSRWAYSAVEHIQARERVRALARALDIDEPEARKICALTGLDDGPLPLSDDDRQRARRDRLSALWGGIFCALSLTACGPGADAWGEGSTDETGVTGDGDAIVPGGELRCVELVAGQPSCWAGWELAWARVMLPCQVSEGVAGAAWAEGYDDALELWGPVVCHDLLAGGTFCLLGDANVLLTEGAAGWAPEVSALVGQLPEVEPPCGACGEPGQPLCGVGDCPPGSLGCDCDGGDCDDGMGCTISNTCIDCQFNVGVVGCSCSVGGDCEGAAACIDGICA